MSARKLRRIAAVLPVAIMLRALSAHADTLSSPPSALEPLRGVADAYARGLDAGWGWPTSTAVILCAAARWWHERRPVVPLKGK
jgi:hypothetical protein